MNHIKLNIEPDREQAAKTAVLWFVNRVRSILATQKKCRVVVPTGGSPKLFYEILTAEYSRAINWAQVVWITLDELYGIPLSHPATFYSYLKEYLFEPLTIPSHNIVAIDSLAEDPQREAARFASLCKDADIAILGMGADGHIGMNFPPASKQSAMHLLTLPQDARPSEAHFHEASDISTKGITMGISEILSAKTILLLVDGEKKAKALRKLTHSVVSKEWPVTYLQEHNEVLVFASENVVM